MVGLLALLIVLSATFFIPAVQLKVARQAQNWFNNTYQTNLQLEGFQYVFPNTVYLHNVLLPCQENDTLISAQKVEFSFRSYQKSTNTLNTGPVVLKGYKFNWLKYPGEDSTNFQKFIASFKSDKPRDTTKPEVKLNMASILLDSGRFHYEDLNCDSCRKFLLHELNVAVEDFALEGKYLNADILNLSFKDEQGLRVKSLSAQAAYQAREMRLNNLKLVTGLSELRGDIALQYAEMKSFKNFVNEVNLSAQIEYGYLASSDIQYFAPAFPNFKTFTLRGAVEGPVNNFAAKDFDLTLGKDTRFRADVKVENATKPDSLYLSSSNLKIKTLPEDVRFIAGLFTDTALPQTLKKLGPMRLKGSYRGYLNDFSAQGDFKSDALSLSTKIKLQDPGDPKRIAYQGRVEVQELNLGLLTENSALGLLKANLKLKGKGADPVSMNTSIEGEIQRFDFKDYRYGAMAVNGRINKGEFEGLFKANDPNLDFDFEGKASFGRDTSQYDFVMRVDTANLNALNLVEDSISTFTGLLNIDFIALDYDQWTGSIQLSDFSYEDSQSAHYFQDVKITSNGLDSSKTLKVESAILNAELKGQYTFAGINSIIKNTYRRFNAADTVESQIVPETFSFDINLNKPEILTSLLLPKLQIEPGTQLKGAFADENQQLSIDLKSRGLRYGATVFKGIDLNMISGTRQSELAFNLRQTELASGYIIDSLALENFYQNDTLQYRLTGILRDSIDSRVNLEGFAIQKSNRSFLVGLDSSHFNVGKSDFKIPNGARFYIDSSRYFIEDFSITNGSQGVYVNGAISKTSNEVLRVEMQNFSVKILNYFLKSDKSKFDGSLEGSLIVTSLLGDPKFVTDLNIDSLSLNKTLLGNLNLISDYSLRNDTISLNSELVLGRRKTMQAQGYYQTDSAGSINLDLSFDRFRLTALNPIVSVVATNLRGMLNGNLSIKGKTRAPEINGKLFLPKVAFTISFLQSDYNLVNNPYVEITSNAIKFPQLELRDTKFGTKGTLGGEITHRNFRDFNLDLEINTDELLVLNTQSDENDAYYGRAFATGTIDLEGPPEALDVTARVQTERNTNFNIPIGGATEVKRSNFVKFVSPKTPEDSLSILTNQFDIDKGLSLEFAIEVDQSAQVNIILNQSTGNKLSATGEGQIKLNMSPSSEMQLFGIYTVAKGEYNFNLEGLLNKTFKVQRGGTVNWNGDPYSAQLNITAMYTTRANPQPFLGDISSGNTRTEVYLSIAGPLTNPEISFDIKTPRASSTVQAVLSNRLRETEAMNQQVFSLLAFNSFTPQSNFLAGTSGGINEWDIIANQAAAYLNRFTGGYEVSLSYQQNSFNNQDANTAGTDNSELEVGVSKDFLDERLTISSSVGVPLNSSQGNVAGDFEITYSLTEDGRLRAKAFNRAVDNDFNISLGRQQLYQQGVGLSYQVDFNNLGELWAKVLGKSEEGRKEEEPQPKKENAGQANQNQDPADD